MTIERLGRTCAVVWRTTPSRFARWLEEAVYDEAADYESNLRAAEDHAKLAMTFEVPTYVDSVESRKDQRANAEAGNGSTARGRPRKTAEEKKQTRNARQKRYRDKKAERVESSKRIPLSVLETMRGGLRSLELKQQVAALGFTMDEAESQFAESVRNGTIR